MLKLVVIADDFTGALDTGVQFANLGVHTQVTTEKVIAYDVLPEDLEVLVIDTESRYLSFEKSYQIIKDIMERAQEAGVSFIYKKVDSALRGNIASELKAVLDSSGSQRIPFVPIYPELQRVLRDGQLLIDGVPVAESVFGQDPYEPVLESNIRKRLMEEANITSQLIQKGTIIKADPRLLVFDGETAADLERIRDLLVCEGSLGITVGCAGFARVLAETIFPDREPTTAAIEAPLVVICGSVNPITQQQVTYAEAAGHKRISLRPQQLLETEYWTTEAGQADLTDYLHWQEPGGMLLFETFNEEVMKHSQAYCEAQGIPTEEFRFRVGSSLGNLSQQLLEKAIDGTLLFTGGDTLFQSMEVLAVKEIKPIREISSGVVLSELLWQGRPIQVITKSGGFGQPELFTELNAQVKSRRKETC